MEKTLKQQPSNCLKIVLYGPESTGKSTLAKSLADHFNTCWVPEFMRGYLQKKWDTKKEKIVKDDLIPIAEGQLRMENEAAKKANKMLLCDTNLLELKVYSEYYYNGFCPEPILKSIEESHYDLYLLTHIDLPWVADDLRDNPDDRLGIFRIFENELIGRDLQYKILSGSMDERMNQAISHIENATR